VVSLFCPNIVVESILYFSEVVETSSVSEGVLRFCEVVKMLVESLKASIGEAGEAGEEESLPMLVSCTRSDIVAGRIVPL
jgi:hypothetical protein